MHDYLLSTEWVRFAFVLGIATSMVLYERRHLTTGSIVVPGYIAVFLIHPLVILATFLNAFITYALVNKVLRRYVLLYGRTKFTVLAVLSTLIQTMMLRLSPSGPWLWERDIAIFVGAGYIVPALIAHDMARQGIAKTTKSVLLAGAIVAIPIALALALDLPGVNDLAPVDGFGTLAFPMQWLPIAVVVSIVASWAVAHNYGYRSGGFIGATFIGMFMADPWQVAAAVVIAGVSYVIVAKILMHHMILFGRRKFSAMLLTSSAIAWPALWLGNRVLPDELSHHLAVGSLALTPLLLPGLVANDVQRTSPRRVAAGLALASLCSVTWTWWIGATVTGQHLALGWKVLALMVATVLTWPQLALAATRVAERLERWAEHRTPARYSLRITTAVTITRVRRVLLGGAIRDTAVRTAERLARLGGTISHALAPTVRPQLVLVEPAPLVGRSRWDGETAPRTSWDDWATSYPDEAAEAMMWLDLVLAEATAEPSLRQRHEFVDSSRSILVDALVRPSTPTLSTPRGPRRLSRRQPDRMLAVTPPTEFGSVARVDVVPSESITRNPEFERAIRTLVEARVR